MKKKFVKRDGMQAVKVPMHHLAGIICLGPVGVSPYLMAACTEKGISISFLTERGRFLAQVVGARQGNVLLRRDQYRLADDATFCLRIAKMFVKGKIANARSYLVRCKREKGDSSGYLAKEIRAIKEIVTELDTASGIDIVRGLEGEAANRYFGCFTHLLKDQTLFHWGGRNRRPPRDPANAVLSFAYTLLAGDCSGALQGIGLDVQVGFLHRDRPGRPALALDLMEEFRVLFADRLFFRLVNREQLRRQHFDFQDSGAVFLNEAGRKILLTEYQKLKRVVIRHPLFEENTSYGFLLHMQAQLLARVVRGDLDIYPPFIGG